MQKDFDSWNVHKKKTDSALKRTSFKEKYIWWCSIGLNVDDEENGKGAIFARPVLVFKKFHSKIFVAIPLSSKIKDNNPYYYQFMFLEKKQSAIFQQIKVIDSKRLVSRMGRLPEEEFSKIKVRFTEVFI